VKICLVTAFPPSRGGLNEYGLHVARALTNVPQLKLTILADQLGSPEPEIAGFRVIRCWSFNALTNPVRLSRVIHELQPDVVWFNLGFASFGSRPLAAFCGFLTPGLVRLLGYYTHVTLHQIMDMMNLADARVKYPRLYRLGGWMATHLLLTANSISVLIPAYRRTLIEKYRRNNVHFRPHGILCGQPEFPDLARRGNPQHRILAFGKWGTYKRLEPLIGAFRQVAVEQKGVRLIIAGGNHPETPGYVESVAQSVAGDSRIEFTGYVPEEDVPQLFRSASLAVLPYSSAAGSSGVAHLACEYGLPIVAADLPEFRDMAAAEGLAICFCEPGNTNALADAMNSVLERPDWQREMAERNFSAALRMTMPLVVRQYLRLFDLNHHRQIFAPETRARRLLRWLPGRSLWAAVVSRTTTYWHRDWPAE
jgi:glycosyltransferase involved in cell wall biosynthesis